MSQVAKIEALKAALPTIEDGRKEFAHSLIGQFESKGKLSDKQWYWVVKLAEAPVEPVTVELAQSFSGVIDLFNTGSKKLKYPTIILQTPSKREMILTRAADYSKNPGYVYVKLDDVGYAGKVSPTGKFFPTDALTASLMQEVTELLGQLAADPAGTAAAYGKLVGNCCFCAKALDNPKSLAVGYGPTCAKNYGLPYGVAATVAAQAGITPVAMIPICTEETVAALEAADANPEAGAPVQLPLNLDDLIKTARGK